MNSLIGSKGFGSGSTKIPICVYSFACAASLHMFFYTQTFSRSGPKSVNMKKPCEVLMWNHEQTDVSVRQLLQQTWLLVSRRRSDARSQAAQVRLCDF